LTTDTFYLNGKNIKVEKHPLLDFNGKELMRVWSSKTGFESYILTKGAPFIQLLRSNLRVASYLESLVSTNLIINLLDGFEPTQSRTDIRIENEEIYTLIEKMAYFRILELQLAEPDENYVQNMTSRANIHQILPPKLEIPTTSSASQLPKGASFRKFVPDNLINFLWYYKPDDSDSLADILWRAIGTIRKKNEKDYEVDVINPLPNSQGKVIGEWMRIKNLAENKPAVDLEYVEGGNIDTEITNDILEFADYFVRAYVKALDLKINPPEVIISLMKGRDGEFDIQDNIIRLSSKLKITDPPENLTVDNILGYIDANFGIYGKRFPSSIMIHELEHFRRQSTHGSGFHGNIMVDGKDLTFDQSANYYYDLAIENGMLNFI
jgi:hypothetical protein